MSQAERDFVIGILKAYLGERTEAKKIISNREY
jgi:hypothetical protein